VTDEAHPISWSALGGRAKMFRIAHTAWAVVSLAALGDIWVSAIRRRHDRWLAASVAWLLLEGVALVIGRGDCPAGPLQRQLGDPVPLFELVLPPRAAKAAIPILTGVAAAGIALAAVRGPREVVGRPGRR
jgi:hypothetical protein